MYRYTPLYAAPYGAAVTFTPEDIDRMQAEAVARGVDPDHLERLRQAALAQVGGDVEELARWLTFWDRFAFFKEEIRRARARG
ncbi:hypothetical protein GCM10017673_15090 [Streptosporangium violaceochromogenes]|nr:hypothetical protein GCM10017673_15090 [Streptosporangium violaceochromogenes]